MNPSSMDPLQGANASSLINANREALQNTGLNATGDNGKESRTQKLERTKAQVASGTYSPNLQSLASKLIQGNFLKS